MSSLYKYLNLPETLKRTREQYSEDYDRSVDVKTNEYPNYDVIRDYTHEQQSFTGFNVIIGGCLGVLVGVFLGLPLLTMRYRSLGYRDMKLLEKLCLPLIGSTLLCATVGATAGAVGEGIRILEEREIELKRDYYNRKIVD